MQRTGHGGLTGERRTGARSDLQLLNRLLLALRSRLHLPTSRRITLGVGGGILAAAGLLLFALFAGRVQTLRVRHAAGPAWSFPSRVYSEGLPLTPGRPLPPDYLAAHLELRGYRAGALPLRSPGTYAARPDGMEIFLRGFLDAPDPAGCGGPEHVRLRLSGARIARVTRLGGCAGAPPPDTAHAPRLEPIVISVLADEQRVLRTWVPLDRIPRVVRDAIVAAEDRRFHRHAGFDPRSNVRALVTNVQAGGVRQGGSTITQQLARGLFLGRERTLGRKLSEVFLALGLEIVLSKDQILEMYLNSVYWGQGDGGGVAGVAEAARYYYDAPVESLGLAEAALLAGLIPGPNAYSPFRNPRGALARRNAVLGDMVAAGVLDARVAAREKLRPPGVRQGPPPPERFPSFTGRVREELARRLPAGAPERWGLAVFTTLDPAWQSRAEAALAEGVLEIERSLGRRSEPLEGAFVAIESASGSMRALVGGRAPRPGDFNRATQAHRQPGSAVKPVVYAAALDPRRRGRRFSPASTVPDLRRQFSTPEGPWQPRNDEGEYHDRVTLAKALAKSLNVATTNLVEAIGPAEVVRSAERFGLGKLRPVPSVGLGTSEVTLLALTDAYATFPGGGIRHDATSLRAVLDARGRPLLAAHAPGVPVLPQQTAALMTGLLEDVVIFGVSYPLRARYGFTRPVAGKTGTTNDYNDAWFVGFTPDVVAGVWVGYDTPRSLGRPAAEIALPVWARIMTRLLEGFPPTPFPQRPDIELAWIDPWTGDLAGPQCPSKMRVPFARGTAPRTVCGRDHTADWQAVFAAQAAESVAAYAADSAAKALADTAGRSTGAP
jgi:penicillin-binding protein 1B